MKEKNGNLTLQGCRTRQELSMDTKITQNRDRTEEIQAGQVGGLTGPISPQNGLESDPSPSFNLIRPSLSR